MDHLIPPYLLEREKREPDPRRVQRLLEHVLAPQFSTDAEFQRLVLEEIAALKGQMDGQHGPAGG